MFRALFDLESDPDPHPIIKIYRNRVFVSETWNDNHLLLAGVGGHIALCPLYPRRLSTNQEYVHACTFAQLQYNKMKVVKNKIY